MDDINLMLKNVYDFKNPSILILSGLKPHHYLRALSLKYSGSIDFYICEPRDY